jgi:hypothetical protein
MTAEIDARDVGNSPDYWRRGFDSVIEMGLQFDAMGFAALKPILQRFDIYRKKTASPRCA